MWAPLILAAVTLCIAVGCSDSRNDAELFPVQVYVKERQFNSAPLINTRRAGTICEFSDADECQFLQIAAADLTGDGSVVLAPLNEVLREFDSSSRLRKVYGSLGSGPGEYRGIMDVTYDDQTHTTDAFDIRNFRLVTYDSSGAPLRTVSVPMPPPMLQRARLWHSRLVFFSLGGVNRGGDTTRARFYFASPSDTAVGEPRVTVAAVSYVREGSDLEAIPPLFAPRAAWDIAADGRIAFTPGTPYRIEIYDSLGKPLTLITSNVAPREVTKPTSTPRSPGSMRPALRHSWPQSCNDSSPRQRTTSLRHILI